MSKTSNPIVAQKLIEERKRAGKTQKQVAAHLGIAQQAYSRYETCDAGIPIRKLLRFCKYVGIPANDLLMHYEEEELQTV
jgi:transcriptional regulator with XRE-family HTH domain